MAASKLSPVEEQLLQLVTEHADGLSDSQLQQLQPQLSAADRVTAVNSLLSRGRLQLLKRGSQLLYQLKSGAAAPRGSDAEEKVVYDIVAAAGSCGVWVRDIRYKSNLGMAQLNKLLKAMENRRLIKSVISVAASRKKVYMLYDVEPDQSVTGGAWYSDNDFESEFVEVLGQQCRQLLQRRAEAAADGSQDPLVARRLAMVSSREVCDHIGGLGISRVKLGAADIERVLDTLVYDGQAERCLDEEGADSAAGGGALYRSVVAPLAATGLTQVPCGLCPVADWCSPTTGAVTPLKCDYMSDWLS